MYQIGVVVACAVALAVLFIFAGWSEDKSNVGTVATPAPSLSSRSTL
jgi:hypothetical protein